MSTRVFSQFVTVDKGRDVRTETGVGVSTQLEIN